MMTTRAAAICLYGVLFASSGWAQSSGFILDVPQMEPLPGAANALVWRAPNLEGQYGALYFDPPEIFLAPDSDYKGIQPEAVTALSEALADALTNVAVLRGREVVEEFGPAVVRVRSALSSVYFRRRSGPGQYAFSFDAFKLRAAMPEVSLVQAVLEFEFLDSQSGERLGVLAVQEGQREVEQLGVREYHQTGSPRRGRVLCGCVCCGAIVGGHAQPPAAHSHEVVAAGMYVSHGRSVSNPSHGARGGPVNANTA